MNENNAAAYLDDEGDIVINIQLSDVDIAVVVESNLAHVYCLDKKTNTTRFRKDDIGIKGEVKHKKIIHEQAKQLEHMAVEIARLEKIREMFIEIDKRIVWESLGLGNSLAEEIEDILK